MKWRGRRSSKNIEDRRGSGVRRAGQVGGVGLLAALAAGYFLGIDVTPLLNNSGGGQVSGEGAEMTQADKQAGEFVSVTLAATEEIWTEVFRKQLNRTYKPVTLVLFKGVTRSPCGSASGATGPFYCPGDKKVYLDTDFFTTLSRRFGAKGDFAAAYVVAHEVAHHVQDELGVLGQANNARQSMSTADSNKVSVRIELQADCFSGIWARYAEARLGILDDGDILEAVNAAKQIGDDTLQRAAGQRPMPHTFTHGSAEQRQRWFAKGYKEPAMSNCDSFAARSL